MAALALDSFCGTREALYGVFDGDRNVEVPYLLQCTMGDVLAEELHRSQMQEDYMTNTFLTMQRYTHIYIKTITHKHNNLSQVVFSLHLFVLLQETGHSRAEDGRLCSFVPHQTRPCGSWRTRRLLYTQGCQRWQVSGCSVPRRQSHATVHNTHCQRSVRVPEGETA